MGLQHPLLISPWARVRNQLWTHAKVTSGKILEGRAAYRQLMWVEFKRAPNLMLAEMWKEVLEGEGLPTKLLPEGDILDWAERVPFLIYVPKGREHVAEEILRKL